jgi:peptidoglycan/xylan/chitin deacetylase (PgdA/CDA1 family)
VGWNKTPQQLVNSLKQYITANEENLINTLHRIGQESINWARENGSYTDRTGNLRNSIGYIIFKDGKEYDSRAERTAQGSKQTVINLVQNEIPDEGYALVTFAGMEYGIYVEARGYTVLTGAFENIPTAKLLEQALGR